VREAQELAQILTEAGINAASIDGATDQKKRASTSQTIPGIIAQVSNDGLHDESGYRSGNPQNRNLFHIGTQRLKNPAHVSILEGESELDPKESETHVPDLRERKLGFFHTNFLRLIGYLSALFARPRQT
jgi:hypothetical protein